MYDGGFNIHLSNFMMTCDHMEFQPQQKKYKPGRVKLDCYTCNTATFKFSACLTLSLCHLADTVLEMF